MHPFHFTAISSFRCVDPDSAFVFEPEKNKFHWYGRDLDKMGKYKLVKAEALYLELEWNYGREQAYTVVSNVKTDDEMRAFVLKDNKTGKLYSFSK